MAKPVSILKYTVLFSTVLALAACTNSAAQDLKLNKDGTVNQYAKQSQADTISQTGNSQIDTKTKPTASATTQAKQKGALTMKTLQDFQPIEGTQVTLTTTQGDVTFELFREDAPLTTLNFLTLAKAGFYDNIIFHRVIPGFMAQVGDPLTKDPSAPKELWGTGGTDYVIADEFSPKLRHNSAGIVSMANRGPNTGGSQIFITYDATPHLDDKHAVFGKVTQGMDVLEKITIGDKILSVTIK